MSDLEALPQWILSETGLRTSQVDAMLAEVEQALTTADAKLVRVRKAVADIPETAKTLRAVQRAEDAAEAAGDYQHPPPVETVSISVPGVVLEIHTADTHIQAFRELVERPDGNLLAAMTAPVEVFDGPYMHVLTKPQAMAAE